jgi:hypothetical protein
MASIFTKLDSLDPIVRELIIHLVCGIILFVLAFASRFVAKQLAKKGSKLAWLYAENWLQKYLAHHAIFGAKDLPESLRLFFQVILASISWMALAGLILVFFYGVEALAAGRWFIFLGHWFALNCLLEAFLWAKDSRNDKIPKAILEEKQKQNQIPAQTKQP